MALPFFPQSEEDERILAELRATGPEGRPPTPPVESLVTGLPPREPPNLALILQAIGAGLAGNQAALARVSEQRAAQQANTLMLQAQQLDREGKSQQASDRLAQGIAALGGRFPQLEIILNKFKSDIDTRLEQSTAVQAALRGAGLVKPGTQPGMGSTLFLPREQPAQAALAEAAFTQPGGPGGKAFLTAQGQIAIQEGARERGGVKISSEQGKYATASGIDLAGRTTWDQLTQQEGAIILRRQSDESVTNQIRAAVGENVAVLQSAPWNTNPRTDKSVTPYDRKTGKPLTSVSAWDAIQRDPALLNDQEKRQLLVIQDQRRLVSAGRAAVSAFLAQTRGEALPNALMRLAQQFTGGTPETAMWESIFGPGRLVLARAFQGAASQLSDKDVQAVAAGLPRITDVAATGDLKLRVIEWMFESQEAALLGRAIPDLFEQPWYKAAMLAVRKAGGQTGRGTLEKVNP